MATTVTTQFKGSLAGDVLVQAYKGADTIAKNAITVLPNIIGNAMLPKLSYNPTLQAYACGFSPQGTLDYNEKEIQTKALMLIDGICKRDFANTYASQSANLFGANTELPGSIQEALLSAVVKSLGQAVDNEIWNGLGATAASINGLIKQFLADATVVKVTLTASTVANVVANIQSVYDAIIPAIEDEDDLVIVVGKNVAKRYKQAQALMGDNTTVGQKELDYLGVRMESLGGLPANAIAAYRVKNVALATSLESDMNEVLVDDRPFEGDYRTKVAFNLGVGYSFGQEIVWGNIA